MTNSSLNLASRIVYASAKAAVALETSRGIELTRQEGWGFSCPIHGLETHAFCFRAFMSEHSGLWRKTVSITLAAQAMDAMEIVDFLDALKASRTWGGIK